MNKREFTKSMLGGYERIEPTTDASRGYINGYRYGVEYPTNGKKPDLPDDIFIDVKCEKGTNEWQEWTDMTVADAAWTAQHNSIPATSFKIVDSRYKPSDTSYLVERGMELVNQIQEKLESVTEKLEANSWYDYDNQKAIALPPIGVECLTWFDDGRECWHKCLVLCHSPFEINVAAVSLIGVHDRRLIWSHEFKPLDWNHKAEAEKKRVVDAAMDFWNNSPYGPLTTFEKMYEAGYLVLPQKKEE